MLGTRSQHPTPEMPEVQETSLPALPDHLLAYRQHLVAAEQKAQEDFDKTVLSLSGGALGVSFVFLKDVIGANPIGAPGFLLAASVTWGSSTLAVLASYYMSQMALRDAIRKVDFGVIYGQRPGGRYATATAVLNATGAVLFLAGVLCITVFAAHNFPTKRTQNDRKETATATTTPAAAASAASSATAGSERSERPANRGLYPASTAASSTK
jgi:hypothetical protein